MKNNGPGPCLASCYKEEKFIYLIIGFILGVLSLALVNRILQKPSNGEPKKDLFPSASKN